MSLVSIKSFIVLVYDIVIFRNVDNLNKKGFNISNSVIKWIGTC